jgi:hypothetical protein
MGREMSKPRYKPTAKDRTMYKFITQMANKAIKGKLLDIDVTVCNLVQPIVSNYGMTTKLIRTGTVTTIVVKT